MIELENQVKDLFLERNIIAQVTVQIGRINILAKSGEWYYFGVGWNYAWDPGGLKQVSRLLVSLFQGFCSQTPSINMWSKVGNEWQKAPLTSTKNNIRGTNTTYP